MDYINVPNFVLIGLSCCHLVSKIPKFYRFFGLMHLLVSPSGKIHRKLNNEHGYKTTNFPYCTAVVMTCLYSLSVK